MILELTSEDFAVGLDRVTSEILEEAGVERPPVDAFAVAKALGIAVGWDDRQTGRARYVRLSERYCGRSRAAILIAPDPRSERRQWAVAHEIGEHAAYRVYDMLGMDPCEMRPNSRETVANYLASRLMLPSDWFAADGPTDAWDLIALKKRYQTASHELIARRMLDFLPTVIISIFDHRRISFRRSNLPGRVPPLSSDETECWRNVHQQNRPIEYRHGPDRIHGWPIHEEGWKREILRRELDEASLNTEEIVHWE